MTAPPVEVDLWLWPIGIGAAEAARLYPELDETERARADRFVHDHHAHRFIAAHARMRRILADYTGAPPSTLAFRQGLNKRPFLPGGPAFNLSHSHDLAALAVTRETEVLLGADIERQRDFETGVTRRVLADDERAALDALPPPQRAAAFFLAWTRKEAVIKATGEGLYADLKSFSVTLTPGTPAELLRIAPDKPAPANWRMHDFTPAPGYAGAIAAMTAGRDLRVTLRS